MAQNVGLSKGSVAIEPFFDATQEMLSGGASNFRLVPISNTSIRALAGTDNGNAQSSISVQGRYRFRTTNIDAAHPGGAAGTYDVYATATANDFTGPSPNIDLTDYAFGLTIRAAGSPPATPHYRKVGEVGWDGSKLTSVRQWVPAARDGDSVHVIAPHADFVPFRVQGAPSQTARLTEWVNSAGTVVAWVDVTGQASFASGGSSSFGELSLSGSGGKDTLALTSTDPNTGITIGGDVTLYRPAADVLATDDELRVVRAAGGDVALSTRLAADSNYRFRVLADGSLAWADGDGSADATLGRAGSLMVLTGSLQVSNELRAAGPLYHSGGSVGFFGATPTARNTGWGAFLRSDGSSAVSRKTLAATYTMDQLVDVLWTMKEAMVAHGLWGP